MLRELKTVMDIGHKLNQLLMRTLKSSKIVPITKSISYLLYLQHKYQLQDAKVG